MSPRKWISNRRLERILGTGKPVLFLIAAAFCCAHGGALAGDPAIPNEARKKWAEYIEFAKRLQGKQTEIVTDRLANNKVVSRTASELKVCGFAMACGYQYVGPAHEPEHRWYVRNEQYGFELWRASEADGWAVAHVWPSIGDGKKPRIALFLNDATTQPFVPLNIYRMWLPETVESNDFVVTKFGRVTKNGLDLARVDFRYSAKRKPAAESGWFLLDPSLYWVVREYEVNVTGGFGDRGTSSYSAEFKIGRSGHPLLVKSHERIESPGEKASVDRVIEYTLSEDQPPSREFTFAAFGLPDLSNPTMRRSSRYLWVAAIGFLCLVAGITFWFRRRQANTTG